MKKTLPWIIAVLSFCIGGWAFVRYSGSHASLRDLTEEQQNRLTRLTFERREERKQTEELRRTHADAKRIVAQQQQTLHQKYENLYKLVPGTNGVPSYPSLTFFLTKQSPLVTQVKVALTHKDKRGQWLPSRYIIALLNADGFVTAQVDSGWYDTSIGPGQKLSHSYDVSFNFGTPVYYLLTTRRQKSFCP